MSAAQIAALAFNVICLCSIFFTLLPSETIFGKYDILQSPNCQLFFVKICARERNGIAAVRRGGAFPARGERGVGQVESYRAPHEAEGGEPVPAHRLAVQKCAEDERHRRRDVLYEADCDEADAPRAVGEEQERRRGHRARAREQEVRPHVVGVGRGARAFEPRKPREGEGRDGEGLYGERDGRVGGDFLLEHAVEREREREPRARGGDGAVRRDLHRYAGGC